METFGALLVIYDCQCKAGRRTKYRPSCEKTPPGGRKAQGIHSSSGWLSFCKLVELLYKTNQMRSLRLVILGLFVGMLEPWVFAYPNGAELQTTPPVAGTLPQPQGVSVPSGYTIGPEDILTVYFWREKDMGGDVVVRPDGKISLPILNDVPAAGLTPEQLASDVEKAAAKYLNDAKVTVIVKEIRSRKVFVVGEVGKPGWFVLGSEMTVLQAIAQAGGLLETAKRSGIVVVREVDGRTQRFPFNYNDVLKGKKPEQNIKLQPGDTILVR